MSEKLSEVVPVGILDSSSYDHGHIAIDLFDFATVKHGVSLLAWLFHPCGEGYVS